MSSEKDPIDPADPSRVTETQIRSLERFVSDQQHFVDLRAVLAELRRLQLRNNQLWIERQQLFESRNQWAEYYQQPWWERLRFRMFGCGCALCKRRE